MTISDIFRGTCKRISDDEKPSYHKSVDVYWQTNAWADTNVCGDWAKSTLAPAMTDHDEYVLLCDNLDGQNTYYFVTMDSLV